MSPAPFKIGRASPGHSRKVFDRASGTFIGVVTQHLNDDLWYFHELDDDGEAIEDASGRSDTMSDAAGQLHDSWLFEQGERT